MALSAMLTPEEVAQSLGINVRSAWKVMREAGALQVGQRIVGGQSSMPARCGLSSHRQGSGSCGGASSPAPSSFRAILGDLSVEVTVTDECWSMEDAVEVALFFLDNSTVNHSLELGARHVVTCCGRFSYDMAAISANGWRFVA